MTWYPEPKPAPESLDTLDLHLEVLGPEHVELDYDALMSTRERLMRWSGGRWPHEGFTLAENMEDMVMHRNGFLAREAFTYTVLNRARDRCEGCVYIYPLAGVPSRPREVPAGLPDTTARVTWWVRDDALERGLDRQLIAGLIDWFRAAWEFDAVTFLVRSDNDHDIGLLDEAGLERVAIARDLYGPGEFVLYRLPLS